MAFILNRELECDHPTCFSSVMLRCRSIEALEQHAMQRGWAVRVETIPRSQEPIRRHFCPEHKPE